MGVERVDYSSDDEFWQAQQEEERQYREHQEADQMEQEIDNCIGDLGELIERYSYDMVKYCLGNFENKK